MIPPGAKQDCAVTTVSGQVCIGKAWEKHRSELLSFSRRRLQTRAEAEDVVQDVFVKALKARNDFCQINDPRAWLFAALRNVLTDRFRRTSHMSVQCSLGALTDSLQEVLDTVDAVDELSVCLPRAIREMAAQDARILTSCALGNETVQSYADANGLSLPAGKARLFRARQKLRAWLVVHCHVRIEDGKVEGFVVRSGLSSPP